MGEIKRMKPRKGTNARAFVEQFLEDFGDELDSVMIVGRAKDGCIVDGWSDECHNDVVVSLGMLQQFLFDFWHTVFQKRSD